MGLTLKKYLNLIDEKYFKRRHHMVVFVKNSNSDYFARKETELDQTGEKLLLPKPLKKLLLTINLF